MSKRMTPTQVMLAAFGAVGVALVVFARKHGEPATIPDVDSETGGPLPPVAAEAIRQKQFWNGRLETEPSVENRLVEYWTSVLGRHPSSEFGSNWVTAIPWSAAFVSYVANQAAPGSLSPERGHWNYAQKAVDNVGLPGKYAAFEPGTKPFDVGDILVRTRTGDEHIPFSDLKRFGFKPTHGDIVIAVEPEGRIRAIGGNLTNSVREALYTQEDPRLIAHLKLQSDVPNV